MNTTPDRPRLAEPKLVITRVFAAPRATVWAAWTTEQMAQWAGPAGFTIPSSVADVRPGGSWRACMRSEEHGEFCQHGVYHEVVAPERLVFTTAWEEPDGTPEHEMLVTVTFADLGDRTEMTFEQATFSSEQSRDSHVDGWSQCFDKLETYLATGGHRA